MGIGNEHKILLMFSFGTGINSTPAVVFSLLRLLIRNVV